MDAIDLTNPGFWKCPDTYVLANPRDALAVGEAEEIRRWIRGQERLRGHLLFRTSGSSGKGKWVALSKSALLSSARAVNDLLGMDNKDCCLMTLPLFHVGGFGVAARAFAAGCHVIEDEGKWDAERCYDRIGEGEVTLSSLVPAQLADLVALGRSAPVSLRAILIGGGRLSEEIYQRAVDLGWPIRETYGMTETASQVATTNDGDRRLKILPIWKVRSDDNGQLQLSGEALLSGYVGYENGQCFFDDPCDSGWLTTNDLGTVKEGELIIHGRVDRCIKILGELINLADIEESIGCLLRQLKGSGAHVELMVMPERGEGDRVMLTLCHASEFDFDKVLCCYHVDCHPLHRISKVVQITSIPRTSIGKINFPEIQQMLKSEE